MHSVTVGLLTRNSLSLAENYQSSCIWA